MKEAHSLNVFCSRMQMAIVLFEAIDGTVKKLSVCIWMEYQEYQVISYLIAS